MLEAAAIMMCNVLLFLQEEELQKAAEDAIEMELQSKCHTLLC